MPTTLNEILRSHRTGRAAIMGILNVTPDSFSDGGAFLDAASAERQAWQLVQDGADIIDVGAESTRPGSRRMPAEVQIERLRPVLGAVVATGAVVSVDTTLSAVAQFAMDHGVGIINDISAGRDDPAMLGLAANRGAAMVLMHMQGQPQTMQQSPEYGDVVAEVHSFLGERLVAAASAKLPPDRCILDVGIGFGKTLEHNLELLANLHKFTDLQCPILAGPSRKGFLGQLTGQTRPADRVAGTVAACLAAWRGGATIFRVHDVRPLADALAVEVAVEKRSRRTARENAS